MTDLLLHLERLLREIAREEVKAARESEPQVTAPPVERLSTTKAAERYGMGRERLATLAKTGVIPATREGTAYMVFTTDVEAYLKEIRDRETTERRKPVRKAA